MESPKDVGKNVEVSACNFALTTLFNLASNGAKIYAELAIADISRDRLQELVDRDEGKPVLHENTMKQFGKCPVCNTSVAIQFHSDFCGKCGNRLKWRGEGK